MIYLQNKINRFSKCFYRVSLCLILLVLSLVNQPSIAERGDLIPSKSSIVFYGSSNIHSFQGSVKNFKGFIYGDNKELHNINYLQLQFDPISFSTNNTARDENLKKTLVIDKYPLLFFRSNNVLVSRDGTVADITGRLTIKNISKRIVFTAYLSEPAPREIHARGSFWIKLSDYNLRPVAPAFIRMNDKVRIKFDAVSNWVK